MIEVSFLAWGGFYDGAIGQMLTTWEQAGVFSYVLPFLMIFALVFTVIGKMKIFGENRAVTAIIALAVGLMSLQFEFVPRFFSEVFPRVGVGLAIILVILIIAGLFIDPEKSGIMYVLLAIGAIIIIVVLINTSNALGYTGAQDWIADNWAVVVGVLIFLVGIGLVIWNGNPPKGKGTPYRAYIER